MDANTDHCTPLALHVQDNKIITTLYGQISSSFTLPHSVGITVFLATLLCHASCFAIYFREGEGALCLLLARHLFASCNLALIRCSKHHKHPHIQHSTCICDTQTRQRSIALSILHQEAQLYNYGIPTCWETRSRTL